MPTTPPHGRRLRVDDLLALDRIVDARISPDGIQVAYVVRRADPQADAHRDAIWLADGSDGAWRCRPLLPDGFEATSPRWSPDGERLAFVARASGVDQVHVVDRTGGDVRVVTSLPDGVSDPAWSPDGTRLAVLSVDASLQGVPVDPLIRHVRRLPYRLNGRGYIGDRFSHLWLVDVATGAATQLTAGPHDESAAAWSPDGTRIAFTSLRGERPAAPWKTQLYVIDSEAHERVAAGGDGARLLSDGVDGVGPPAWSADGTRIVVVASAAGARLSSDAGLYVVDADGGAVARRIDAPSERVLDCQPEFDTSSCPPCPPTWTPDGAAVLFGACERGRLGVYRLELASGTVLPVLGGERAVGRVTASGDGRRLAFVAADWSSPGELHVSLADGSGERRITGLAEPLATCALARPELLRVPTRDGRFVLDAWLFRPARGDAPEPRPIVQMAHGGPDGTFGPAFLFLVQLLAARGFNVLLGNARGGLGYGEAFEATLGGHYGEVDEDDHWTCLEAAAATGGVDPDRAGIYGHSYGGFMAAWMTGRTGRYRAAVASSIMADFVTQSLTADYGGTYDWAERGEWPDLWADPMEWWRRSPIAHVPSMRTPILFLMGEDDWRTPAVEHDLLFTALAARGVPTEMVRFVGAHHGVATSGAPRVRVERMRLIVEWFERWLGPDAAGSAYSA